MRAHELALSTPREGSRWKIILGKRWCLQDYFKLVDAHWDSRRRLAEVALPQLDNSMKRYRAIQTALVERPAYRATGGGKCNGAICAEGGLEMLWEEASADVNAVLDVVDALKEEIAEMSAKLAPCTRLLVLLIR